MIIVCQNCTGRFRIDDAKVPAGSFSVSCPKCQATVSSNDMSEVRETSALAVGKSPSTSNPRFQRSIPAPLFKMNSGMVDETPDREPAVAAAPKVNDLALSLMSLLKPEKSDRVSALRPVWEPRRVLVCTIADYREKIARCLTQRGYEVFIAADTQQAVERMRESHVDVVILDQAFDPIDQGTAFVTREVNVLRPAQRRRIFFVSLSSSKRTMDAHAAFLHNVNIIVNLNDLGDLAEILERSMREFNELYKDFNAACGVAPL